MTDVKCISIYPENYKTYLRMLRERHYLPKIEVNKQTTANVSSNGNNCIYTAPSQNNFAVEYIEANMKSTTHIDVSNHNFRKCALCSSQKYQRNLLQKLNANMYKSTNQLLHAKYALAERLMQDREIKRIHLQASFTKDYYYPCPPPNSRSMKRREGLNCQPNNETKYEWSFDQ